MKPDGVICYNVVDYVNNLNQNKNFSYLVSRYPVQTKR
jgi:hypothetical protein